MTEWTISVTQLNEYVRKMLSGDPMLRAIKVRGEISGFKRHFSGHLYFTLKDEGARVQCVMFKQQTSYLNFQPRDGMKVVVTGSASLYTQSGAYQLYIDEMKQEGAGELFMRFEALKAKLSAEGLFDPSLKKPIPALPKTIGVVTSRTGAVLRDIVRVARRRNPKINILLAAAGVQDAGAAAEIVEAIRRLNRDGRADVILCGRGGGSIEDLWPFNEEIVARAIAGSSIPVISCVGHETDFTIADFVADLRAPTPSAAAELAVPVMDELLEEVELLTVRMNRALLTRQELNRARLERLIASPALTDPKKALIDERRKQMEALSQRLENGLSRSQEIRKQALRTKTARLMGARFLLIAAGRGKAVDALTLRLDRAMERQAKEKRAQVESLSRMLESLNPGNVLERGYAAVYMNGKTVGDSEKLPVGARIDIRMRDGALSAEITGREGRANREDVHHGEKTDL